jgi:hypothetical protein
MVNINLVSLPSDLIRYILDRSPDSTRVLIRQVCRKLHDKIDPSPYFNHHLCKIAAAEGYLNLVVWAKNKGYTWKQNDICEAACLNGHIDIIEFSIKEKAKVNTDWIDRAIMSGHVNMIDYARSQFHQVPVKVAYELACKGDLISFKKLVERVYFTQTDYSMMAHLAAACKHIHILLHLKEKTKRVEAIAAKYGLTLS